jgi:hypothetical protein
MANKEPNFIYNPITREWKTVYVPISKKKAGTTNQSWNNKNTSHGLYQKPEDFVPYTKSPFKQSKINNHYKSTKPSKSKVKQKQFISKTWQRTSRKQNGANYETKSH